MIEKSTMYGTFFGATDTFWFISKTEIVKQTCIYLFCKWHLTVLHLCSQVSPWAERWLAPSRPCPPGSPPWPSLQLSPPRSIRSPPQRSIPETKPTGPLSLTLSSSSDLLATKNPEGQRTERAAFMEKNGHFQKRVLSLNHEAWWHVWRRYSGQEGKRCGYTNCTVHIHCEAETASALNQKPRNFSRLHRVWPFVFIAGCFFCETLKMLS